MHVYRITTVKWSTQLTASGNAARWNSKDRFVIYAAGSRALACLENVVHRSSEGLAAIWRVMVIEIPDSASIEIITAEDIDEDWSDPMNPHYCRSIGDRWLAQQRSLVLQVPSVIIREESNFLINPYHPDFKRIKLKKTELFEFDPRIKRDA